MVRGQVKTKSSGRQSSYRRERKTELSSTVVTSEMWRSKDQEKERLKKCNNRLADYIHKMHDIVEANKALKAENAALRKSGKRPEQDIAVLYEDEMTRLRTRAEELAVENQKLEITKENLQYDLTETKEKLEEEQDKRKAFEKEVKGLRKDIDDATIEKVTLESKLENLQETLQLERQAHAVELENLRSQVQPVTAVTVENEPSLVPDFTDAVQSVRREYESFTSKSTEVLDAFYKEKVDHLNKQLRSTHEDNLSMRRENGNLRKTIHQLEMELNALRSKTGGLQKQIEDLEDMLDKQSKGAQQEKNDLSNELDNAKLDLAKYFKEYQDLNNLKLSLDQEIAIYNKLLQREESRTIKVETADGVLVVKEGERPITSSPPRSRSHSSSQSSTSTENDAVEDVRESEAL